MNCGGFFVFFFLVSTLLKVLKTLFNIVKVLFLVSLCSIVVFNVNHCTLTIETAECE
jgi:hypothetical protein